MYRTTVWRTRPRVGALACLLLALTLAGVAQPAEAYPARGRVLVSGPSWDGVTVYSNGGPGSAAASRGRFGLNWQCVELAQRFFHKRLGFRPKRWGVNAKDMFRRASEIGLLRYPNGGRVLPQWGDLLVFRGGRFGHVAVVTGVSGGRVSFVEQNLSRTGRGSLAIRDNRVADRPPHRVIGWVRSPRVRPSGMTDLLFYNGDPTVGAVEAHVRFSDGFGGWSRRRAIDRVAPSATVATGRFDGDDRGDVLTYEPASGKAVVRLARSDGRWTGGRATVFPAGMDVYAGRFNDDALSDVLLHDPHTGLAHLFFANGRRGWRAGPVQVLGVGDVLLGRLNDDGMTDLMLYEPASGTLRVVFADGAGGWLPGAARGLPSRQTLVAGTFDGDGLSDLFLYGGDDGSGSSTGAVLFADGAGGWRGAPVGITIPAGWQVHAGHFSSDSFTDLLFSASNAGGGTAVVLFADGTGRWRAGSPSRLPRNVKVYRGRFNGDGLTDVFLYTGHGDVKPATGRYLLADGRGGWRQGPKLDLAGYWRIATADFGSV